jgi:F0F1-type ATP synthase membrane subunit a
MSEQATITTNSEIMETPSAPVSHEATLFAEPLGHIGSLTVTNSLLASWIAVFVLVMFLLSVGKRVRKVPRGVQNIFEIILEKALELADSVTGSRKKSEKFLPISLALFLFIFVNNWMGLLPGMGTIGFNEVEDGHKLFIPLFRGGTADINTTLALALFAVIASHVAGVLTVGVLLLRRRKRLRRRSLQINTAHFLTFQFLKEQQLLKRVKLLRSSALRNLLRMVLIVMTRTVTLQE